MYTYIAFIFLCILYIYSPHVYVSLGYLYIDVSFTNTHSLCLQISCIDIHLPCFQVSCRDISSLCFHVSLIYIHQKDLLARVSLHHAGCNVPPPAPCKLKTQERAGLFQNQSGGLRTGRTSGKSCRLRAGPGSTSLTRKGQFSCPPLFCSIQSVNRLSEAHPGWRRSCALLGALCQRLNSVRQHPHRWTQR